VPFKTENLSTWYRSLGEDPENEDGPGSCPRYSAALSGPRRRVVKYVECMQHIILNCRLTVSSNEPGKVFNMFLKMHPVK